MRWSVKPNQSGFGDHRTASAHDGSMTPPVTHVSSRGPGRHRAGRRRGTAGTAPDRRFRPATVTASRGPGRQRVQPASSPSAPADRIRVCSEASPSAAIVSAASGEARPASRTRRKWRRTRAASWSRARRRRARDRVDRAQRVPDHRPAQRRRAAPAVAGRAGNTTPSTARRRLLAAPVHHRPVSLPRWPRSRKAAGGADEHRGDRSSVTPRSRR